MAFLYLIDLVTSISLHIIVNCSSWIIYSSGNGLYYLYKKIRPESQIQDVKIVDNDYIIITRFDIIFNNEFSKYDINYDKINLECMFVPDYNSGDNFILFKRQYLDLVNKSTKKCMECNDNSHQLYKYFNESGDICHYIGGTTTKRNPHYDVMFRFTRYV